METLAASAAAGGFKLSGKGTGEKGTGKQGMGDDPTGLRMGASKLLASTLKLKVPLISRARTVQRLTTTALIVSTAAHATTDWR